MRFCSQRGSQSSRTDLAAARDLGDSQTWYEIHVIQLTVGSEIHRAVGDRAPDVVGNAHGQVIWSRTFSLSYGPTG
jgi:hypothetical protein